MTTVVRLYHSGVVDEFRDRERALRDRHGYDVHLVCPPAWPEGGSVVAAPRDDRFPVHVVPVHGRTHPILFWYSPRGLRRVLRQVRPQIVDVHEEPYSLAASLALREVAKTVPRARVCIYTAQNIYKRYPPPFRQLEASVLRRAHAAYPCSAEAGDVLRRKGFGGALHTIPLGVSTGEPAGRDTNGTLRVGFVGRLVEEKGAHLALKAFAKAATGLPAALELVGAGPEDERLRALAGDLGLAGRAHFTGALPQDEALDRIAALDVLVVPSLGTPRWKEQFGRVAAQAFATGTPVLAAASGSLPEVVGDSGELFAEGDAEDLAAKLRRLLLDGRRRAELAAAGRRRAESEFTWARVADRMDAMYRELLRG